MGNLLSEMKKTKQKINYRNIMMMKLDNMDLESKFMLLIMEMKIKEMKKEVIKRSITKRKPNR